MWICYGSRGKLDVVNNFGTMCLNTHIKILLTYFDILRNVWIFFGGTTENFKNFYFNFKSLDVYLIINYLTTIIIYLFINNYLVMHQFQFFFIDLKVIYLFTDYNYYNIELHPRDILKLIIFCNNICIHYQFSCRSINSIITSQNSLNW